MDYLNAKLLRYYKRGFERTGEIYLSLLQLNDMKVDRNRRIEHGAWHESHQISCAGLHAEIIRRRLWLRSCQTISRLRGIDRRPFDFILTIIAWNSPHVKWFYWFLTFIALEYCAHGFLLVNACRCIRSQTLHSFVTTQLTYQFGVHAFFK